MAVMVVWIDQDHSRLFYFSEEKMERKVVQALAPEERSNPMAEAVFFDEICAQLLPVASILLMGPGEEKSRFMSFLQESYPLLGRKIVGCETLDAPSDQKIATVASRYFKSGKTAPGW